MSQHSDRSYASVPNRFGQLSKNMFFARHVPHPRYLKFITGTAGVQVCHVRDNVPHLPTQPNAELARSLLSDPKFTIEFPPNSYNEALLRSYAERVQLTKRRERFLPPLPGWNASGTIVEDTENWRHELNRIAEMVGLVTAEELSELQTKKPEHRLRRTPSASTVSTTKTSTKSAVGEYSTRTGRWNETPRVLSRSRSFNRRTPLASIVPSHLFCVDEQERETWLLQVLCQILQTDDMVDVQSWLVSSTPVEKETVRQLISSAIKGLEESGRIHPSACFEDGERTNSSNVESLATSRKTLSSSVNAPLSESLLAYHEQINRSVSRPQTAPDTTPTVTQTSIKSSQVSHPTLESIDEKSEVRGTPAQSKSDHDSKHHNHHHHHHQHQHHDHKHNVQVLTLSDTDHDQKETKKSSPDQAPF